MQLPVNPQSHLQESVPQNHLHNCLKMLTKIFIVFVREKKLEAHGLQHLGSFVHHYFLEFAQIHGANHSVTIESVMFSNHLILCCPLLLLPSIFPSIRVFSTESALHIRWPNYWSFSFRIHPSNEYSGLISFRSD